MEFLKSQFDKLLLIGLFLVVYFIPMQEIDWVQRTLDILLGAIVGLITGRALARRSDSRNGNGLNSIT